MIEPHGLAIEAAPNGWSQGWDAARRATSRPDVAFVACIESGVVEAQALLLFESIRRFGARLHACPIYAVSPRPGRTISPAARQRLARLDVRHIEVPLNTDCPEYGSANRVAAAAYVEQHFPHEILVIADSDTIFLREPAALLLPPDVDAAVRPVDQKNVCTSGPYDRHDRYWRELCRVSNVGYDIIPWSTSFIDEHPIKACYNGGLVVVRGRLGIMRRWADIFFASVRAGLVPEPNGTPPFRSGAGWVSPEARRLWGSNQAALSLALWSTTRRVRELPPTYNYPLHLFSAVDPVVNEATFPRLVHAHYHWLFSLDAPPEPNPLFKVPGPLSVRQRAWLPLMLPLR